MGYVGPPIGCGKAVHVEVLANRFGIVFSPQVLVLISWLHVADVLRMRMRNAAMSYFFASCDCQRGRVN